MFKAKVYSQKDIDTWLANGVSSEVHWFPADVHSNKLAETMAGMANTRGGHILIGVSPRGGEIQGIQTVSKTLDLIFQAALLLEPTLVIPVPSRVVFDNSKIVVVIQVPPGLSNVYRLDGRYWHRQAAHTVPIPVERLRGLLIERGEIHFERQVPPDVNFDQLEPELIKEYMNSLGMPEELTERKSQEMGAETQFLMRRGCLLQVNDQLIPTYAGLLMFNRSPKQWLPSAIILAARFSGSNFSDEFIKQEIHGSLPEQLRQAEAFLRSNIRTSVRMEGLKHQEVLEYPFEAVRELLVNAVAHRDYNAQGDTIHIHLFSDRLEIHSPGGLPGPVNLDNLLQSRFARNAVISQLLADLGFVERLGYGLDRVVSVMQEQNFPPPKFEEVSGSFRVTLYNKLFVSHQIPASFELVLSPDVILNARQELALKYLQSNRRITNKDYQDLCPDVHMETLRRDLADLVSQSILMKIGDKKATYYILKENLLRKIV